LILRLRESLNEAPWQVGEIFDSVEDCYDYWIKLLRDILQEHLPLKRMKVRTRDVSYMTTAWKSAIRAKRNYSKRYSQNSTPENLDLKRKWTNEATRQRRMAIKQYWKEVSHDLRRNPKKLFQTFKPFSDKKEKEDNTSMAKGIGGEQIEDLTEDDFIEHSSLRSISTSMEASNSPFVLDY